MRVSWNEGARRELDRAILYVGRDSPKAALTIFEEVISQTRLLADHPFKGRKGRQPGTRELVILRTPYLVVYRVSAKAVTVLRVLHGAQRWPPGR